jgi:PAS domain S-box-containing protein
MVEQHLGHALEVASEWLMVLEGKRIIYSNHGFPDMAHWTDDRPVGLNLNEVLPGDVCEGLEELIDHMDEQQGRAVTGSLRCFDEGLGPTTFLVRGERSGAYTYLSLRRPLDDEDMADGKLLEVEDKLSALLGLAASAGLGVGVFELSSDGELLPRSFNEHVVSIFDRSQEEMVGTNPAEWMHPDDRPRMEAMVRELYETGSNRAPVQLRALDSSGGVVHIQVSNSMLSPPNDHLGISFIQDLTPMREALDQQNRMVQAMERVEDTVVLADARGRIFYANSTALRNTGYTLEEVLGQPISIFTAPEGAEEFAAEAMMEFLRKGWWRGNTMASTKDGKLYPVEVVGTAVRDDQGELSMIVVISRKTQERQRFEAQLLMAKSNSERLVDHMEQRLLPDLETAIERIVTARGEEVPVILDEMRAALRKGRELMDGLPHIEEAMNLRPVRLVHVLEDRLPSMVVSHKVAEKSIAVSIRASDKDLVVMANDMLPDLIVRIMEVLMEMAEFGKPRFAISIEGRSLSDVRGSRVQIGTEGEEPLVTAISITCPGLNLNDELRSILTRQELHTLGPLTPEQTLAVETSRLLLFLYEGRIVTEKSPKTGEESVVILLRQV